MSTFSRSELRNEDVTINDHDLESSDHRNEKPETSPYKYHCDEPTAGQNRVYFGKNSVVDNPNITIPDCQIPGSSKAVRGKEKLENEIYLTEDDKAEHTDVGDIEERLSELEELLSPDSPGSYEEHAENVSAQKASERRKRSSEVLDGYQIPMCSKSMVVEKLPQGNCKKERNDASSSGFDYSKNISRSELNEISNAGLAGKYDELCSCNPIQQTCKRRKQSSSRTVQVEEVVDEQVRKKLNIVNSSVSNFAGELELSELEEMLDADLPNEYKKPVPSSFIQQFNERRKQDGDVVEIEKNIFQDINADNFDLLPEGWIQITHNIGIPVYLDRRCRICTLARPYFLGSGNVYNHKIPLSAIPCLQYRQVLEKKSDPIAQAKVAQATVNDCMRLIGNIRVPIVKIETVCDNQRSQSLDATKVRDYCQKLFEYRKGFVKRDKNIKNKQHSRVTENHNFKNRPSLPPGTKLLSFMVFDRDPNGEIVRRRECVMNPSGRSYIAILHEYLQQSLRIQPVYQYEEKDNEYEAVVKLKDTIFGRGVGVGKKEAKLLAAKAAVEKLIPELDGKAEEIISINLKGSNNNESVSDSNNIFDEITITDPRVSDFCSRTTEPSPYAMLQTCLRRNCGTVDIDTDYIVSAKHNKHNQFTMTVGKHTVTVSCRNKREGKQKAAQQILQGLHPQLKTWGSLVRLYGNRSVKNAKEKKLEEQEITQLQTLAKINSPNYAILNKLKAELEKLYEKKERMKPIGQLVTNDVPTNSGANLNPLNYS